MDTSRKINRRAMLQLGLGVGAGSIVANGEGPGDDTCEATPEQIRGPFYPVHEQEDKDVDMTRVRGRDGRAQGETIYVRGVVTDEDCHPIPDVLVEIWQANARGRYDHERDRNPAPIDPNFQSWGEAVTDDDGYYGFKTIKPAAYPLRFLGDQPDEDAGWRTPHIHFRLARRGYHELVTQMYFEGEPLNDDDGPLAGLTNEEKRHVVVPAAPPGEGDEPRTSVYRFDLTMRAIRSATVSPDVLRRYVGRYAVEGPDGAREIEVSEADGQIFIQADPFLPPVELRPISSTTFSVRSIGSEVEFGGLEDGRTAVMTLRSIRSGIERAGRRIDS